MLKRIITAVLLLVVVLGALLGLRQIHTAIFILQEFGILIVFILAALLSIVIFTFQHKYTLKDLIATIFIMFYPILLFSPFFIINGSAIGLLAIMLTLFVPILTDTMAYFV
ncbi:MAG: hypothetical protein RR416_06125, partial [Clostridia bacterium]